MVQEEFSPTLLQTGQCSIGRSSMPCHHDTSKILAARRIAPEDWPGPGGETTTKHKPTAIDAEVIEDTTGIITLEEDDVKKKTTTTTNDSSTKPRLSIMMKLSEHAPLACQMMLQMNCSPEELTVEEQETQETVLGNSSNSTTTTIDYQHDDVGVKESVEKTNATTNREHHNNNETTILPGQQGVQQQQGVRVQGGQFRVVSFGTLHIREFPIAIGDNPSVQFGGPPLRLEYESQQGHLEYLLSVDEYEGQRHPRRHKGELRIPPAIRREWVGYSPIVEQQVAGDQRLRNHSIAMADWDEWHYLWECTVRGITKRLQRRRRRQRGGFIFGGNTKQHDEGFATTTNSTCLAEQWCRQYKQEQQKLQTSKNGIRDRHNNNNNRHFKTDPAAEFVSPTPGTYTYSINMQSGRPP